MRRLFSIAIPRQENNYRKYFWFLQNWNLSTSALLTSQMFLRWSEQLLVLRIISIVESSSIPAVVLLIMEQRQGEGEGHKNRIIHHDNFN